MLRLLIFICFPSYLFAFGWHLNQLFSSISKVGDLPHLPDQYVTNWTLYASPSVSGTPPFADNDGVPHPPYCAGRGNTYYNWNTMQILEVYHDMCVPIFQNGSNFQCNFLNTDSVSYLITFEDRPKGFAPCCIFEKPWNPPPPNIIEAINATFNGTSIVEGNIVNWWTAFVEDGGGIFGLGFLDGFNNTFASFYFPGIVNGGDGWATQNFFNFQDTLPDPSVFDVPEECLTASSC